MVCFNYFLDYIIDEIFIFEFNDLLLAGSNQKTGVATVFLLEIIIIRFDQKRINNKNVKNKFQMRTVSTVTTVNYSVQ